MYQEDFRLCSYQSIQYQSKKVPKSSQVILVNLKRAVYVVAVLYHHERLQIIH